MTQYVQSVTVFGSSVTSVTTAAMSTTSGHCLVGQCWYFPTSGFSAFSDSLTQTWVATGNSEDTNTFGYKESYVANTSGNASHTITATLTGSGFPTLTVYEITASATPLDQINGSSDASGLTHTGASVTTTTATQILLTSCSPMGGADTCSISGPFTQDQQTAFVGGVSVGSTSGHQDETATGTYNMSFTTTGNNLTQNFISSWKASTGSTVHARYYYDIIGRPILNV